MDDDCILLVEDNPDDVSLFRRALDRTGGELPLQVAADGLEAVAYLAGEGPYADRSRFPRPSLMLLDLKLPRRSGLEVLAWLREQPSLRDLRVPVLTSSMETSDVARAYELGAGLYLVKPVGFDVLKGLARAIRAYWTRPSGGPEDLLGAYSRPRPAVVAEEA